VRGVVSSQTDGLVGVVGHAACIRILGLEKLAQVEMFVVELGGVPVSWNSRGGGERRNWNDNILWCDASRNLLIFQREFGDIAEVVGKH